MNSKQSRWKTYIGAQCKTNFRRTIYLPETKSCTKSKVLLVKDCSKSFAFAIYGFHALVHRHLLCLCDECLKTAFMKTPDCDVSSSFCGRWKNADQSNDSFPHLRSPGALPNKAKSIAGRRDGPLINPLKWTPLMTKSARSKVTFVIKNKRKGLHRNHPKNKKRKKSVAKK